MNICTPFIKRPIGTTLLAIGLALTGLTAFNFLPVASLPRIDFPVIIVQAAMPGASPDIMATAVATPLERQLGRIAGITDMTSTSSLGSAYVVVMFDLARDINGAARDVQAAINASLGQLPSNLAGNPIYRKVNPADSPIIIITLTSEVYDVGAMYDMASTILQQQLSQVKGVGQVQIGGSSLPAVRVTINPTALNKYKLGFQDVTNAISSANVNGPLGQLSDQDSTRDIVFSNGQLFEPEDYASLILSHNNGTVVRLSDVAVVEKSVENVLNIGLVNNKKTVVLIVFKEPGANVIEAVDNIKNLMPRMKASIPSEIDLKVILDRTTTIRSSLHEVENTLLIAIALVIGVVYVFIGSVRAALIPSVAVPLSLCGTFAIMYLCDYSLDNLSLIALTIATGFVVDDAVVVLENVSRYLEKGLTPFKAAVQGANEVAFTVLSMSVSLIAVFIPILLMGGIVGRIFREFAMTLSIAILVSLVISLTVTPMMCSLLLTATNKNQTSSKPKKNLTTAVVAGYGKTLTLALNHPRLILLLFFASLALSVVMYIVVPKGFFPQQDTGGISCSIQADQNMSFKELEKKLRTYIDSAHQDPAVENAVGFVGESSSGFMFINLKSLTERKIASAQVLERLRAKFATVAGAKLYMQIPQDIILGGRQSSSQFQYTLSADNMALLRTWSPKIMTAIAKLPGITDVNSDQRDNGLQTFIKVNHDLAASLGISAQQIANELYGAFGQKLVTAMHVESKQYYVVITASDKYWFDPQVLQSIYIPSNKGDLVPLSTLANFTNSGTSLSINHQRQFPSITVSFNLLPNVAIGDVVAMIDQTIKEMALPAALTAEFNGTAQAFQAALSNQLLLLIAAVLVVYLVLGMLYENLIHPLTILTTLPSAGLGALLALYISNTQLTVIALIGIILLIGIVKKNAIMMVDFAIYIKKTQHKNAREAIYEAALLRFRPIMMTTVAAILGALPLVLSRGVGYELRQPLGIAIIGGLVLSQMLTLYTTPVIYLMLDKIGQSCEQRWQTLWSKNEKKYINT